MSGLQMRRVGRATGVALLAVGLLVSGLALVAAPANATHQAPTVSGPVVAPPGLNRCTGVVNGQPDGPTLTRLTADPVPAGANVTYEVTFLASSADPTATLGLQFCMSTGPILGPNPAFLAIWDVTNIAKHLLPNGDATFEFTVQVPTGVAPGTELCAKGQLDGQQTAGPQMIRKTNPACFTTAAATPPVPAAVCAAVANPGQTTASLGGTLSDATASAASFTVTPLDGGSVSNPVSGVVSGGTSASGTATGLTPGRSYSYVVTFTTADGPVASAPGCAFTTAAATPPNPPDPEPDPVVPTVACVTPSAVTDKGARIGAAMTNGTASSVRFVLSDGTTVVDGDGADGWTVDVSDLVADEAYTYTATFSPAGLVASGDGCGFRTKQATVVLPVEQTRPDIPVEIGDPATATRPPQVLGEVFTRPSVAARPSASGIAMARTGSDTGRLTALGMLLILGGLLLLVPVRVRRRTV